MNINYFRHSISPAWRLLFASSASAKFFFIISAELLTWQNLLDIFVTIARYILTLFVMIISLKLIDPNNQIRQFVLNLFVTCIPSDLLLGATNVLMLADLYTSVFDYEWLISFGYSVCSLHWIVITTNLISSVMVIHFWVYTKVYIPRRYIQIVVSGPPLIKKWHWVKENIKWY